MSTDRESTDFERAIEQFFVPVAIAEGIRLVATSRSNLTEDFVFERNGHAIWWSYERVQRNPSVKVGPIACIEADSDSGFIAVSSGLKDVFSLMAKEEPNLIQILRHIPKDLWLSTAIQLFTTFLVDHRQLLTGGK